MTRNGKIARLPQEVRHQLNRHLDDGQQGKQLVAWLNKLPQVREVLAREFAARPITEQNLSEWKQGGYEQWRRQQEDLALIEPLLERAKTLEAQEGQASLSDRLSSLTALLMAKLLQKSLGDNLDQPRQRREVMAQVHTLVELRRSDHRQQRLLMEQERHEEKRRQWEREELRRLRFQGYTLPPRKEFRGLSEDGDAPPDLHAAIREFLETNSPSPDDPAESDSIRLDQINQ